MARPWQAGNPVTGMLMDENKVVELSDGRVMLNSRPGNGSGYRRVAISKDGGVHYGTVKNETQLPDPNNNAHITRAFPNAPEGSAKAKVLLYSSPRANNEAVRTAWSASRSMTVPRGHPESCTRKARWPTRSSPR